MRFFSIITVVALLLMLSCKESRESSNAIKIDEAVKQTLSMSDYFKSVDYVPLETTEESLIGHNPTIYTTDEYIVVISMGNCHLFDRATGKFLKKIGTKGNGPNEYLQMPSGIIFNEHEKTIFGRKSDNIIEYSLTGETLHKAPQSAKLNTSLGYKFAYLGRDNWVVGLLNPMGDVPNKLIFFDRESLVDSIPNHDKFTMKTNEINLNASEILFYRYDNDVYYKFLYSDTVFRIVNNRELQPRWIFETSSSPQKLAQLREDPSKLDAEVPNCYLIYGLLETERYVFINSRYKDERNLFLYDKKQSQLTKLESEGFVNDIYGGPEFWPTSTNNNQELVCVYAVDQLKDIVQNADSDLQIAGFKKLQTLVSGLKDDDNPVVLIAK